MALISPATGSILEGPNSRDRTGTALSTNIIMKVNGTPIGAVQTLSVREERQVNFFDEVGTDGHIDSAPTRSTNITGDCQRMRFDRLRITEAFSRGFLHVHAQRIPFDLDIFDRWSGDGGNTIITTIKNVWIKSLGYAYRANDWIILDDMSWEAEAISSTLNAGNAATGGERGPSIMQINSVERQSDAGRRRGSLDVPGLINDFFA